MTTPEERLSVFVDECANGTAPLSAPPHEDITCNKLFKITNNKHCIKFGNASQLIKFGITCVQIIVGTTLIIWWTKMFFESNDKVETISNTLNNACALKCDNFRDVLELLREIAGNTAK